jgi:uncharacterized membrane protein YeaQ/YmgE (transglycosylase-associated protein family)
MIWVWIIIIGGVAGWLAGLIIKGRAFGIMGNIVVGIVGAVLGGWLFDQLRVWPRRRTARCASRIAGWCDRTACSGRRDQEEVN